MVQIDTSEARAEILGKLRSALSAQGITPGEGEAAILPKRTYRMSGEPAGSPQVLEMFKECLIDYNAEYVEVNLAENPQGIEEALKRLMKEDGIETAVVPHGLEPSWIKATQEVSQVKIDAPGERVSKEELNSTDAVVTHSFAGIALTGTICLDNEPDQGRKICTLLPDHHYVVVDADKVFHTVPEAVALMCKNPERAFTWSAGPSATADIELVRVNGVHGPRKLRVIVAKKA